MKRHTGLFEGLVAKENVWRAWRDFRRGKRRRRSVREFEIDAERRIVRLSRELREERYRPQPYRLILLREPKRRIIAAAPVRDRVVHHAIHRVLAPRLERSLVDQTYACLEGRGTHRALLAFLAALRSRRYVLLLDVRHYFLSIDRNRLKGLLSGKLKEPSLLHLLDVVLDSGDGIYRRPEVVAALDLPAGFPGEGCGLPIGNLTSQWWGNLYLSGLDHHVKRTLRIPRYLRYMDDLALFDDDRARLERARESVARWLLEERGLKLKHPAAPVRRTTGRFRYLGHRVSRAGIDPTREALVRMRRRLRAVALNGCPEKLERSIASYRGLLGAAPSVSDPRDRT